MIPSSKDAYTDGVNTFRILGTPNYSIFDDTDKPDIRVWYYNEGPDNHQKIKTITLDRFLELINTEQWKKIETNSNNNHFSLKTAIFGKPNKGENK
jgi:hypothetical protein